MKRINAPQNTDNSGKLSVTKKRRDDQPSQAGLSWDGQEVAVVSWKLARPAHWISRGHILHITHGPEACFLNQQKNEWRKARAPADLCYEFVIFSYMYNA